MVQQAYRYELAPTRHEEEGLRRHVGAARFAHNWAVERCRKAHRPLSAATLHREWNLWKRANAPWWEEVSKCAPQEAFRNVRRSYANWRAGRAREPRFHRRGVRDSFRLTGSIRVTDGRVQLPRIGEVRTKEPTGKFRGRILSATVRREAERWFVSLAVERERPDPIPVAGPAVGRLRQALGALAPGAAAGEDELVVGHDEPGGGADLVGERLHHRARQRFDGAAPFADQVVVMIGGDLEVRAAVVDGDADDHALVLQAGDGAEHRGRIRGQAAVGEVAVDLVDGPAVATTLPHQVEHVVGDDGSPAHAATLHCAS